VPLIVFVIVVAVVSALPVVMLIRYTNRSERWGNRDLGLFIDGLRAYDKKRDRHRH
jgi:hypothetical protein